MSGVAPFIVKSKSGRARRGVIITPHGIIETPAFAPVGTLGAVKGVTPQSLEDTGASLMLSNLYHLALRPGVDAIRSMGGLHQFTGWKKPILTDSGGFQVFSLASLRTVDDQGVRFRNHLDGGEINLTPEWVAQAQVDLGVDIAMMLDECPPWPVEEAEASASLERTLKWAQRGREVWLETAESDQQFFGIVQGSTYRGLRERAVEGLLEIGFDGYAIGGVSVGEPTQDKMAVVDWTTLLLPENRARYLMGVGTPSDIYRAVRCGVDLFDCVLPTRNARHGLLYTSEGEIRIKNAQYAADERPVDARCSCPACRSVSRAFLHHLMRHKELTGIVLATLHNVRFFLDFMKALREAIKSGSLAGIGPPVGKYVT